MSEPLIAIVDDDVSHLAMLQRALLGKARVESFESAEALLQSEVLNNAHMIILDWNLPGMSGLEALRAIRLKRSTPVLFLTSFDAESRLVAALGAGADDYLVKPFRSGELLARIQAQLRRYQALQGKQDSPVKHLAGNVVADQSTNTIQFGSQAPIKLSNKEFSLAVLFLRNVGCALARDEIVHSVWGRGEDVPSRTLDTHISRLRARLNLRPEAGWRLTPVYSFGYRLDKQSAASNETIPDSLDL